MTDPITARRISRRIAAPPSDLNRVLGIDPSLGSTGFAYRQFGRLVTGRVTTDPLRGPHRLFYVRSRIREVIEQAQPTMIVMEDYAMGRTKKVSMSFHIGELGGILKTLFWEMGIPVILVAPTSLKMIIAGTGRADKPMMRTALMETFGYTVDQDDEADACALMLLGELQKGMPVVETKVRNRLRLETLQSFPVIKGRLQSISKTAASEN